MVRTPKHRGELNIRCPSHLNLAMNPIVRSVLVIACCVLMVPQTYAQIATDGNETDSAELAPESTVGFPDQPSLDEIKEFVDQGMVQLAYATLQRMRSVYEQSDDWAEWERVFFDVARTSEDWVGILERSREIAETVPYEFYADMQTHAIYAGLKIGQNEIAKQRLSQLIWQYPYDQGKMIQWRELMIQCYLASGNLEDARIAMSAYNRDYRPSTPQWEHRFARILFVTGHAEEAFDRIVSLQTTESKLLILYSDYLSGARTPQQVVQTGLDVASEFKGRPELETELWALVELAARDMNDLEIQVIAIENGLSVRHDQESAANRVWIVKPATVSQLLATYADLSVSVGNDFNLVVGDDVSWYGLAQEFDITAPVIARAIYSFVARQTSDSEAYRASVRALADNLNANSLAILMDSLFVHKDHFEISAISAALQTKLANRSLRRKDYLTALTIMESIAESEEPGKAFVQLLRRARVAVAVKEYGKAVELIERMIGNLQPDAEHVNVDRIIQVIFDVQNSGTHEFAITLFRQLYANTPDLQTRREILRWISESLSAQDKPIEASEMLLRSARMGGKWDDKWGKSARLEAADELSISGLHDDARVLYSELMDSSLDPRSKALIANRLKNLPD